MVFSETNLLDAAQRPIIEVSNLKKAYKNIKAVDDISFSVQKGEIFCMIGPNGAGKTTTVECIEGLRKPDGGSVRLLGLDPVKDHKILTTKIGVQLQESGLQPNIKVWEALDLYASFYPAPADWKTLLKRLNITDKYHTRYDKLSGGQKQRLRIALALIGKPEIVFLDELTTGLDPQARRSIWQLLLDIKAQGTTLFITTHYMDEAQRLADNVAVIKSGKIVALDSPTNLIKKFASQAGTAISSFQGQEPSLEDVFLELTENTAAEGGATL